jgi:hypothetical protein
VNDYEGEESRFAWYVVTRLGVRRRLCETSWEGLGPALRTMYEDGEIERGDAIGLFDRKEKTWPINPWTNVPSTII